MPIPQWWDPEKYLDMHIGGGAGGREETETISGMCGEDHLLPVCAALFQHNSSGTQTHNFPVPLK